MYGYTKSALMDSNSTFEWEKWFSPTGQFQRKNIPDFVGISASDRSNAVKLGLWRDHSLPAWRDAHVLVSEETAQMISNTVAIALALTLPRLLVFVKMLVPVLSKALRNGTRCVTSKISKVLGRQERQFSVNNMAILESTQNIALEDVTTPSAVYQARISAGIIDTFLQSSSFENAAGRILRNHLAMPRVALPSGTQTDGFWRRALNIIRNLQDYPLSFALITLLAVLLFIVFIGQQVVAISAASILSDSTAIAASRYCGAWAPDNRGRFSSNNSIFEPIHRHYKGLGAAAVTYAETCYSAKANIDQCSYVYQPNIEYHEIHNISCPFLGDVCLLGNNSSYAVDTGYIDSGILGINEPNRVQFRLTKVCAPLVVNESYIQTEKSTTKGSLKVVYRYGNPSYPDRDITTQEYYPEAWSHGYSESRYAVNVLSGLPYAAASNTSGHLVLPEFLSPNGRTTIFLIHSKGLLYIQRSNDPIFPAPYAWGYSVGWNALWENTLKHRTVLGCVDVAQVRHPHTGSLWYPMLSNASILNSKEWDQPGIRDSAFMVGAAIRNADIEVPTAEVFSNHLDASQKVIGFYSSPLAKEQWKVEASKWFRTDLARLQWDMLGIAQGYGHDLPYAVDLSTGMGFNTCLNVKFRSQGWRNVNLCGLFSLLILASLLWASSIEVKDTVAIVWLFRNYIFPFISFIALFVTAITTVCIRDLLPLLSLRLRRLRSRIPISRRG